MPELEGKLSLSLKKFFVYTLVGWTVLVFSFLYWDANKFYDNARDYAAREARYNFNKDQSIRLWVAEHGGVYVPVSEKAKPNPYLKELGIKERDITTPSGRRLTLINPAYFMRLLTDEYREQYGITGHLTSLKLLNPNNAPDTWEKGALQAFEEGAQERMEFTEINGEPHLRLMRPIVAKKGCLKCHGRMGYKEGDIRGGISVSIPLGDIYAQARKRVVSDFRSHAVVWFVGIIGISFGFIVTGRQARKKEEAESNLVRLAKAVEQMEEAVIITDVKGNIEYVNPAVTAITGYTEEELLGQNPSVFKSGRHNTAFYRKLWDTITAGETWVGNFINKRKDGNFYEDNTVISPVTDREGTIVNFVGVKRDVTRENLLARARSYFTAITSHELRTPLTKLQLGRTLLKTEDGLKQGSEGYERVMETINDAFNDLQRIDQATTVLMDLTSPPEKKLNETINLYAVVVSAVESSRSRLEHIGRDLEVVLDREEVPHDIEFRGNQSLVNMVMDEIFSNAFKYTPDGRKVFVSLRIDESFGVVEVRDEGQGIPEDAMDSIFEPYFSLEDPMTHSTGRYTHQGGGMGLGLTIARMIMEYHGGAITVVAGGTDGGTAVRLFFPLRKTNG